MPNEREYRAAATRRRERLSSRGPLAEDAAKPRMDRLPTPPEAAPLPRPAGESLVRRRSLLAAQLPYLACVRSPASGRRFDGPGRELEVATYNVHRWTGVSGGRRF